jgi:methionyl-tRNA synthetase
MPAAAAKIASFMGLKHGESLFWKDIGKAEGIQAEHLTSEMLFAKLENEHIEDLKKRYSGTQKEREVTVSEQITASQTPKEFSSVVDLRVAKIEKIERHPKADKLYVINLETGEGVTGIREERQIVSGLVQFYKEEDLLGKKIIVAYNLKPAKLRGIESRGMLLAAGDNNGKDSEGNNAERVEVLDAALYPTGTRFLPEGEDALIGLEEIDIDTFFSYPIVVKDFVVKHGDKKMCINGNAVLTKIISDGEVH